VANEFAEAVTKMHISSLIELGLVLFLITITVNGLAQLLVIATTGKGSRREA
jgi:phosphate transport system permease protein